MITALIRGSNDATVVVAVCPLQLAMVVMETGSAIVPVEVEDVGV